MSEALALQEIPSQIPSNPNQPPQLLPYRWTKETAAIARAKGIQVKAQQKLQRQQDRETCSNKALVLQDAIRETRTRMSRCSKPEHYERYAKVLMDLVSKLPSPELAKQDKPTPRPASFDPLV